MKLLRIAVEKRRWDLVAHTIVLATASVLKNGDSPQVNKKVSSPSLKVSGDSGVGRVTKAGRGEFAGKKRSSKR